MRFVTKNVSTTVLLTGFGPFPGVAVNPSGRFVRALGRAVKRRFHDVRVVWEVLPTQWLAASMSNTKLRQHYQPDIILHFGVSNMARGFVIENVAHNACDDLVDACGAVPGNDFVVGGGPPLLEVTIPVDEILDALACGGVPSVSSMDAGAYLCNAVLYRSLLGTKIGFDDAHFLNSRHCQVGFIHVPQNLGTTKCALSWRAAIKGGLIIVNASIRSHAGR